MAPIGTNNALEDGSIGQRQIDYYLVPVIGGGKITNPQAAEKIVQQGKADMVFLGRPLLRDPYYPQKAEQGRWDEIQECVTCEYCSNCLMQNKRVECRFSNTWGVDRS